MTRVLLVPGVGGGRSQFRELVRSLEGLAVSFPSLPGRDDRLMEPPCRSVEVMADELDRTTAPGRIVIVGHSLGALVGYELAIRLQFARASDVVGLVVVSSRAPGEHSSAPEPGVTDAELVKWLLHDGCIAPSVAEAPDLLRLHLPTLRAECEAARTYQNATPQRLGVPVAVVSGRRDPTVPHAAAARWAEVGRLTDHVEVDAGHQVQSEVPELLAAVIRRVVGQWDQSSVRTP